MNVYFIQKGLTPTKKKKRWECNYLEKEKNFEVHDLKDYIYICMYVI